jgi:glycosyltransferase involved in cell wall biosynthesis
MPPISVVMPVYNAEPFLRQAIDSILAQTLRDFEFIIIDDGSTDGTANLLESYRRRDARLRVHRAAHQGLPACLNLGLRLASGKYIARMDGDDVSLPERFERQFRRLEANPSLAILGTQIRRINADGAVIDASNVPLDHAAILASMQQVCCLHHPTVMMRAAALEQLGGYRECFEAAEDHDLWLRAAERFELGNLPDALLLYRIHTRATSFRRLEQQVTSAAAAELSARFRRQGRTDPFHDSTPVTRERLHELGLDEAELDRLTEQAREWYRVRQIAP